MAIRLRTWRWPLLASLSLLISGCGPQNPLALSLREVQQTIQQFDTALENANSALLVPLLSPTIKATFKDSSSEVIRTLEARDYITLLRDILENTENYEKRRHQTSLVIHPSGRSAQVVSQIIEHLDVSGRSHSLSERETLTIERIDGKPIITAIHSEPI